MNYVTNKWTMEHNYGSTIDIHVGATFKSFDELQDALNEYMHKTSTVYTIVHSRLITHHDLPKELKYVHIKYGCKQYGHLRSKSKGIRPNQKTFKTDCPSFIYATAVRSRGHLLLKKMMLEHNHITGPEVALLYPEKRKVNDVHRQHKLLRIKNLPIGIRNLLGNVQRKSQGPKKKKKKKKARGNKSTSEGNDPDDVPDEEEGEEADEPSVAGPTRAPRQPADGTGVATLEAWAEKLQQDYGCEVATSKENDVLQGFLLQDPLMKEYFTAFPEFLCIDCCGTLLPGETFVLLFSVEDCAGKAEIVGLAVLLSIQPQAVDWLLSSFAGSNEHSSSTTVVLSNIASNNEDAIKKHFPSSRQLLSPSHCMNVWRQMIPHGETGFTEKGEDLCLNLFTQALNATSESEYQQVYEKMRSTLSKPLITYFRENWHYTRDTWALGIVCRPDFMSSACKLIEAFKRKLCIQSLTSRSLSTFFGCFFIEVRRRREERKNLSLLLVFKFPIRGDGDLAARAEYARHVTPYALTFIDKQFELMKSCKPFEYSSLPKAERCVSVSVESCECPFFTSMFLPCCHLFVRRNFVGMSLYSASLYSERWTKSHYVKVFARGEADEEETGVPLSTVQKLHRASDITNELSLLVSKTSQDKFPTMISVLEQLVNSWKCDETVGFMERNAAEDIEAMTEVEITAPEELCTLLGVDSVQYIQVMDREVNDPLLLVDDEVKVTVLSDTPFDVTDTLRIKVERETT